MTNIKVIFKVIVTKIINLVHSYIQMNKVEKKL